MAYRYGTGHLLFCYGYPSQVVTFLVTIGPFIFEVVTAMPVTVKNMMSLPDGSHKIEPNLFLRVRDGGKTRAFVFRYSFNKARKVMSLGVPPEVSIRDARAAAADCRKLLAAGIDPLQRKREASLPKKSVPTFGEYFQEALPRILTMRAYRTPAEGTSFRNKVTTYAIPYLKDKLMPDIGTRQILEVLEPIWRVKPVLARRLREYLELVFGLAMVDGLVENNPARWRGNLNHFLPSTRKFHVAKHYKALSVDGMRAAIPQLLKDTTPRSRSVRFAIVLGFLTATRSKEFTQIDWPEIDLDGALWTMPADRRKDGRPEDFRVPLSKQAVLLLKFYADESARKGPLFPSPLIPGKKIMTTLPCKYLRMHGYDATMHGSRSTFSSWAAENQIDYSVREACLMHKVGTETTQAYQRSDLLDLRRKVMQQWADVLISVEELNELIRQSAAI